MRHLIFLLAAVTALCAGAQEKKTTKGMVVDNDGIPVAGAVVTVKGSDLSTFTDADGVFSLEVPVTVKNIIVSYPDMYTEKVKIKNYGNTIVTMKSSDRTKWFIDGAISPVVISFGNRCGTFSESAGISIMGGFYRQWGAYVKFGSDFNGAGVIKPISDKVCLYAGVGLGLNRYCRIWEEEDPWNGGYWVLEDHDLASALAVDAGCMIRMSRKFNMTFGVTYITPRHGNSGNLCMPVIGLGYTFN